MLFKSKKKQNDKKRQISGASLLTVFEPKSIKAERFRAVATNIQFAMQESDAKAIVFTSSAPGEGKTTISTNTACLLAQQNKKVIYVDCDMRRPTAHKTFMLKNREGLSKYLENQDLGYEECTHYIKELNLTVMTSGAIPANPLRFLNSARMENLIEKLKEDFDIVILDLPPVVVVSDAQVVGAKADGVVMVVRKDVAYKKEVKNAKRLLEQARVNVLGVVFNDAVIENEDIYDYYSGR